MAQRRQIRKKIERYKTPHQDSFEYFGNYKLRPYRLNHCNALLKSTNMYAPTRDLTDGGPNAHAYRGRQLPPSKKITHQLVRKGENNTSKTRNVTINTQHNK